MERKISNFRNYFHVSKPSDKTIRNILRSYTNCDNLSLYIDEIFGAINYKNKLQEWFLIVFSNILVKSDKKQINLIFVRLIISNYPWISNDTKFYLIFSIGEYLNFDEFLILYNESNNFIIAEKGQRSFFKSFIENKNIIEIKEKYKNFHDNNIHNWFTIGAEKIFEQMIDNDFSHKSSGYKCLRKLLLNDWKSALTDFNSILSTLDLDVESKRIWLKSYEILSKFWSEPEEILKGSISKENLVFVEKKPVNKILVSGMGWSGSGALHDFFKEFEVITESNSEFQHIQGKHGLYSLFKKIKNYDLFRESLLHFFWYSVFGHIISPSYNEHKSCKYAERYVYGKNPYKYSLAVNEFIINLKSYYFCLDDKLFKRISNQFIDDIILTEVDNDKSKYVLLDNVIGVSNIEAIEILNNYKIFVTFRDPRSNYLALLNENFRFNANIDNFISSYKKKREDFQEKCKEINTENLIQVQFEQFVLDESYREGLLKYLIELSIDDKRNKYTIFKPWESNKNVLLHETVDANIEIQKIQKELKPYCFLNYNKG